MDKNKEEEAEGVNLYVTTLSNICNCCNKQKEYPAVVSFASKGLKIKELPKLYYFRAIANANNDERKKKLNKISQKTMFIKDQEKIIRDKIKDKVKGVYRQSSEEYKRGLESLKDKLNRYEGIIKAEEKKKIYSKF